MIIKGMLNGDGRNLAKYLVSTTEKTEEAELIQLYGFGVRKENIVTGFVSQHVMADGTQCEKPFFHAAVQNTDHDRALSKEEWILVADRIEKRLGLEGQGRAIALHTEEGKVHAHIAWTRIDLDTMTARPVPFFKARLKDLARELEIDLGLERVRNHRERHEQRTPRTMEEQQGRRLGVDLASVRAGVLEAWGRTDDGRTFAQAIDEQGHILARGDRRDVVIVYAGENGHGTLALGKRLLGEPVADIRARMDDLDPALLPSVAEARQRLKQMRGRRLGLGEPDLHSEPLGARVEPAERGFDGTQQMLEQELRLHDAAAKAGPEIAAREAAAARELAQQQREERNYARRVAEQLRRENAERDRGVRRATFDARDAVLDGTRKGAAVLRNAGVKGAVTVLNALSGLLADYGRTEEERIHDPGAPLPPRPDMARDPLKNLDSAKPLDDLTRRELERRPSADPDYAAATRRYQEAAERRRQEIAQGDGRKRERDRER